MLHWPAKLAAEIELKLAAVSENKHVNFFKE